MEVLIKSKTKKISVKELIIQQLTFLDELMSRQKPELKLEQCRFLVMVSKDILYKYEYELQNKRTKK